MIKIGRKCAVMAAGASLLLAAVACTPADDKPASPRPAAPSGSAAPTRSPSDGTEAAVAAYRAMWDDLVAVARTSDETNPRLDDHAESGGLGLLRYMMREGKKQGVVGKGYVRLAPVAKRVSTSKVTILDCSDSTHWLQYRLDGTLKNNVPGGHHRVEATVVQHDGRWVVNSLFIDAVGTCAT